MLKLKYTKHTDGSVTYAVLERPQEHVRVRNEQGNTWLVLSDNGTDSYPTWTSDKYENWADVKMMAKLVGRYNERKNVVDTSFVTGVIY